MSNKFIGHIFHTRLDKHTFRFLYMMTLYDLHIITSESGFVRSKYYGDENVSLFDTIRREVEVETETIDADCKIELLTNLDVLGYSFNPISLYFIYIGSKFTHCVFEVHNIPWNEKCLYVTRVDTDGKLVDTRHNKKMHVSPFSPSLIGEYIFDLHKASDDIKLTITYVYDGKIQMIGVLDVSRCAFLNVPVGYLSVAMIYIHALILFLKGSKVYDHIPIK